MIYRTAMPKPGYRTITLPDDLVERIDRERGQKAADTGNMPSRREYLETALDALNQEANA